jgi:hypothetical protein
MLCKYRLYTREGDEAGEAEYAIPIKPGEVIWTTGGRRLRVLEVVPVMEDDSPYSGCSGSKPSQGEAGARDSAVG